MKLIKVELPLEKWEELVRRYEAGETLVALGKEVGCSDRTLSKYLARYGAIIRPPGQVLTEQKQKWAEQKEASLKHDKRIKLREDPPKSEVKPKRKIVEW